MGYVPLKIGVRQSGMKREINIRSKPKLKDLAVFSRQFSTMVNSGLPILRSLTILEQQSSSRIIARAVREVRGEIERGSSLSAAMAKHPKVFNNLYVAVHKLPFIFIGLGIGVYLLRRYIKTPKGREQWDGLKLRVPIFGPLFHKTALARFSRVLGVLNKSGVPILQSLEVTAEVVNNAQVSKAILDVQQSVKQGETLSKPLGRHGVFPPMVVQMLAGGEETGSIDTMLET